MKKRRLIKSIALLLAVLTLFGIGAAPAVMAAQAEDEAEQEFITPSGSILDVITAISYATYRQRHAQRPLGSQNIEIDVTDYDTERSTANGIRVFDEYEGRSDAILLPDNGTVSWTFYVPEAGMYSLEMFYFATIGERARRSPIERSLYINGSLPFHEANFITLNKVFNLRFPVDENNPNAPPAFAYDIGYNHMRPPLDLAPEWRHFVFRDSAGLYIDPFMFFFEEGYNTISLFAQREPMVISDMVLFPYEGTMSYEEYVEYFTRQGFGTRTIDKSQMREVDRRERWDIIDAQFPNAVSDTVLHPSNDGSSPLTFPQHPSRVYLNTMGGGGGGDPRWTHVGQWVRYAVEVPAGGSGFYRISMRSLQNTVQGSYVSRLMRVQLASQDHATVPFREANFLAFPFNSNWEVNFLGDGEQYFTIFLEEGVNYIEFEANLGAMGDIIRRIGDSMAMINEAYISILRLTGPRPDRNRDYGIYRRLPSAVHALGYQARVIEGIIEEVVEVTGAVGQHLTVLEGIVRLLDRMGQNERELAGGLDPLRIQLGSLGTWMNTSRLSPLQIDFIEIHSGDADSSELARGNANFFQVMWHEIQRFIASFFTDFNSLGIPRDRDYETTESVEVWTTMGREQAQIIRELANSDFAREYGIGVELMLVAGGTLLPSVLAGVGPDVSLGHGSTEVINWAIRNALVELTDFEGMDEVVTWFPDAAMIPITLHELRTADDVEIRADRMPAGEREAYRSRFSPAVDSDGNSLPGLYERYSIWALPMEISFNMMFYRADIFHELGIEPPRTWDELHGVAGVLAGNNMEIGMPTSMGAYWMFLHQYGGYVYADGGRRVNFDDDLSLSAWETMAEFFQIHRFPIEFNEANRFRTGQMPLIIGGYGLYTQLSVFATEIRGLWEFMPIPGVVDEYGNINNVAVSDVSSTIMLRGAVDNDNQQNAWKFMRWFVGHDNQVAYANEITALIGAAARHGTANRTALEELPWTTNEMNNLLTQFDNLTAVRDFPGSYILERYVRFAFLDVYNENAVPQDALLQHLVTINRELSRRREEFNFAFFPVGQGQNQVQD